MSFDEIFDPRADVFFLFYNNCYGETIHDCSYTRQRIMSSVSPYSRILWVIAIISIMSCVQQMVPEKRQVYRRPRAEACGTWSKISQTYFMLPQETHHHLLVHIHFETRTGREKKAPHAPMDLWLTCRRLAWSFQCIAVRFSRWVWRPKPGQQKIE